MKPLAPIAPTSMPDLDLVVEQLCAPSSLETVLHHPLHDSPMPSLEELGEIMSRLKATLFPGYFGVSCVHVESMRYHLSANLDSIFRKLAEQIRRGGCFACASYATDCMSCEEVSMRKAMEFMQRLPHIRRLLASDAKAAYEGDPAATSAGETIFCYPSLLTMTTASRTSCTTSACRSSRASFPRWPIPLPASISIRARPLMKNSSSITEQAWSSAKPPSSARGAASIRA